MNSILETNASLEQKLKEAHKLAVHLRDTHGLTDPIDVTYIGLALEAAGNRRVYHEKLAKLAQAEKKAEATGKKAEKEVKAGPPEKVAEPTPETAPETNVEGEAPKTP